VSRRPDGRYEVGEVVSVSEGVDEAHRARAYEDIVLLSYGGRGVVVQFDSAGQPALDTIEHAAAIARTLLPPRSEIWSRRNQTIEPFTH
jgi:hypothetical protein